MDPSTYKQVQKNYNEIEALKRNITTLTDEVSVMKQEVDDIKDAVGELARYSLDDGPFETPYSIGVMPINGETIPQMSGTDIDGGNSRQFVYENCKMEVL